MTQFDQVNCQNLITARYRCPIIFVVRKLCATMKKNSWVHRDFLGIQFNRYSVNWNLLFSVDLLFIHEDWERGKNQFSLWWKSHISEMIDFPFECKKLLESFILRHVEPFDSKQNAFWPPTPYIVAEYQTMCIRVNQHILVRAHTHSKLIINYISWGLFRNCKMHQTITYCIHCICTLARKLKTMKIYVQRNCFRNMKNSLCLLPWRQWKRTPACARALVHITSQWTRIFDSKRNDENVLRNRLCEYEYPMHSLYDFISRSTYKQLDDREKRDAEDAMLKWLVLCLLFSIFRFSSEWSCVRCPPRSHLSSEKISVDFFLSLLRCVVRGLIRMVNTSSTLWQNFFHCRIKSSKKPLKCRVYSSTIEPINKRSCSLHD